MRFDTNTFTTIKWQSVVVLLSKVDTKQATRLICVLFTFAQQMLEDKLRETDWEVTQESIEEQVARESYLQWLKDNEKRAKKQASVSVCSLQIVTGRPRKNVNSIIWFVG